MATRDSSFLLPCSFSFARVISWFILHNSIQTKWFFGLDDFVTFATLHTDQREWSHESVIFLAGKFKFHLGGIFISILWMELQSHFRALRERERKCDCSPRLFLLRYKMMAWKLHTFISAYWTIPEISLIYDFSKGVPESTSVLCLLGNVKQLRAIKIDSCPKL